MDAIGLNHLMFSTPEEVAETVRLTGATDASAISTFVTPDPGAGPGARAAAGGRARGQVRRAQHPLRHAAESSRRPSSSRTTLRAPPLEGRCLYPFLYARVSFSGKVYFCPFIRVEVGDLTSQSLEEVWTGERYVSLRQEAGADEGFSRSAAAAARSSWRRSRSDAAAVEEAGVPDAVLAG